MSSNSVQSSVVEGRGLGSCLGGGVGSTDPLYALGRAFKMALGQHGGEAQERREATTQHSRILNYNRVAELLYNPYNDTENHIQHVKEYNNYNNRTTIIQSGSTTTYIRYDKQ